MENTIEVKELRRRCYELALKSIDVRHGFDLQAGQVEGPSTSIIEPDYKKKAQEIFEYINTGK